jgi:hypothetical protein
MTCFPSWRSRVALAALFLALPSFVGAQNRATATRADSLQLLTALVARQQADADSSDKLTRSPKIKGWQRRIIARGDSILALATRLATAPVRADTVRLIRVDTLRIAQIVTRVDTVRVTQTVIRRDTVYVTKVPVPSDTVKVGTKDSLPPPPVVVVGASVGPAAVAELPRATVNTLRPVGLAQTRLAAGGDLQRALDACAGELVLPVGATYIGNFTLPARTSPIVCVIRTDLDDAALGAPGTRMTPTKAAAVRLAKILSPNNGAVITTDY